MRFGISSFAVRDFTVLDILSLGIDHIEIGFESDARTQELLELCEQNGLTYSFHVPVTHFQQTPIPHFAPASNVRFRVLDAVALTNAAIEKHKSARPRYLVVHFPSANDLDPIDNITLNWRSAEYFLREMDKISRENEVTICLENLSVNPRFCTGGDYLELIRRSPLQRLCLDVGHAFLVDGMETIRSFGIVASAIEAVHIYDYKWLNGKWRKVPFAAERCCFGDIKELADALSFLPRTVTIVHEANGEYEDLRASLATIRRSFSDGQIL